MSMPRLSLAAAAALACALSACASITPEARRVMVYSENNRLLDRCQQLGPVSAEVSEMNMLTLEEAIQQAKNDLRHQAATRYKADAVVLVNTDITQSFLVRHATLQGVALKCHP